MSRISLLAFIFDPRQAFLTEERIFPFGREGKEFVKGVKLRPIFGIGGIN
ncbi:MAG: hypothetical protein GTO12_05975 [Proteobacteria bacterium]|nr:hypothetical protein [Pseudomonadota bacterium]